MNYKDDLIFTPAKSKLKTNFSMAYNSTIDTDSSSYSRIIDREGEFNQSVGKMSLRKKVSAKLRRALYSIDLFHSIVDTTTPRIIFIICVCYMSLVFLFALPYWFIGVNYPECNMMIHNYIDAFGFSVETAATIGYDTADIFFGDCIAPLATIGLQICVKLVADALAIGILYSRLSRPAGRASTIIFSKNSVFRRIRGKLYFMFQLCELRKHQLSEVQIRLYLVRRDVDLYDNLANPRQQDRQSKDSSSSNTPPQGYQTFNVTSSAEASNSYTGVPSDDPTPRAFTTHFQTCTMRLLHPNDASGSQLLLCLPQVVVHEVDAWSPLLPPPVWMSAKTGDIHAWQPRALQFAQMPEMGSRTGLFHDLSPIPPADATPPSHSRLQPDYDSRKLASTMFPNDCKRMTDAAIDGEATISASTSPGIHAFEEITSRLFKRGSKPMTSEVRASLLSCLAATQTETSDQAEERKHISKFIADRQIEVIAIVEGVDPNSGGVVQARYSYTYSDMTWDHTFEPCVCTDADDGSAIVDFSKFHDLLPAPFDAPYAGSLPSWT